MFKKKQNSSLQILPPVIFSFWSLKKKLLNVFEMFLMKVSWWKLSVFDFLKIYRQTYEKLFVWFLIRKINGKYFKNFFIKFMLNYSLKI